MHYVIGDVHGCFDEMMELLTKIEKKDDDAQFVFVGDLIDRGPKVWETLDWAMKNITPDGKYQSVMGNHEELVVEWYKEFLVWWDAHLTGDTAEFMPETHYDFSKVMDAQNMLRPGKLKPIIEFFESFPYSKSVEVETIYGQKILYRIVHAAYNYYAEDEKTQRECNLWDRNYWGYPGNNDNNEIVIHGHTPTISDSYLLRGCGNDAPGMIGYRENAINIDGGCCYLDKWWNAPCMLCAICLETLEEIYPSTVEERFLKAYESSAEIEAKEAEVMNIYCKEKAKEYCMQYREKETAARQRMLIKIGKELSM